MKVIYISLIKNVLDDIICTIYGGITNCIEEF